MAKLVKTNESIRPYCNVISIDAKIGETNKIRKGDPLNFPTLLAQKT